MEETRFNGIIQIDRSPYELWDPGGELSHRWQAAPVRTQIAEADLQQLKRELNDAYVQLGLTKAQRHEGTKT